MVCLPWPAFILALFGVALSIYSMKVIQDIGNHVNTNWAAAKAIIGEAADSRDFETTPSYRTTKNALLVLRWVFVLIGAMSLLQLCWPEMTICQGPESYPHAEAGNG